MSKLNISINKFKSITLMETINCTLYKDLEESISYIAREVLKELKELTNSSKLTNDKKIEFFLKKSLLSCSSNTKWINLSQKHILTEDYLYVVLKKFYFKFTNSFMDI